GPPAGPGRADVPGRDDAHPQPAPPDRRGLGGRPPRRRSARETGPPDRRRGGQAARGAPGVGAGPGTPTVALAAGVFGELAGRPPRPAPLGRHSVIFSCKACTLRMYYLCMQVITGSSLRRERMG